MNYFQIVQLKIVKLCSYCHKKSQCSIFRAALFSSIAWYLLICGHTNQMAIAKTRLIAYYRYIYILIKRFKFLMEVQLCLKTSPPIVHSTFCLSVSRSYIVANSLAGNRNGLFHFLQFPVTFFPDTPPKPT